MAEASYLNPGEKPILGQMGEKAHKKGRQVAGLFREY
ncbi:MAG: hypothetical protein ACI8P9_001925 [Parasphingorhabdus sp.]|jgi:hypothetical protein